VDANDEWYITLDAGQSITCVAHYVWGSVEFTEPPEWTDTTYFDYLGEGWQTAISGDYKVVYLHGPEITNTTDIDDLEWFSYNLFYKWDNAIADPCYPVYVDTALYNGPPGSAAIDYWGWKGIPGNPSSWVYRDEPYYKDVPGYEDGFFSNPVPEPLTFGILGLGTLFLRRRRPPQGVPKRS
jgi:hypothetical protein